MTQNNVVALWPASGITLWLAWRYDWRAVPAIFFGHFVYGYFFMPIGNATGSAANAIAAYVAVAFFRRYLTPDPAQMLRTMAVLLGPAALLQALVSALLGVTILALKFNMEGWQSAVFGLRWFLSDVAGAIIIAPIFFAWSHFGMRPAPGWWRSTELLTAVLACVALAGLMQFESDLVTPNARLLLVSAPVIIWLAMRTFSFESALATALVGLVSLTAASKTLSIDNQALLETQLFLCMYLVGAHLIQALLHQQTSLNQRLSEQSTELELRVRKRTAELEEARAKAEAADEAKSEFLANTSHEVRIPLNAILGMAEFLAQSKLDVEQQEQAETIITAGRSLMAVLNDVIDLSKAEAGKLQISAVPTNIEGFTRQITALWRPAAVEKGLDFKLKVSPQVPAQLLFDNQRLLQCVSNLLSNAIKFTESGVISVAISAELHRQDKLRLAIQVTDSGIGMSESAQQKLFRPFEQLDASISRRFGGTGLGLAITRNLARLMDGEVSVSSSLGIGTTFTLTIEAEALTGETIKLNSNSATEQLLPTGLRVLLIEDNVINRKVAMGHLKKLGCTFTEAEHGAIALEKLEQKPFDLVLLDVHMPVMDGIETIGRIRSAASDWASIPVIALTADAMIEDRKRLLELGMDGYASKPIQREDLIAEMLRVLEEPVAEVG